MDGCEKNVQSVAMVTTISFATITPFCAHICQYMNDADMIKSHVRGISNLGRAKYVALM